MKKYVHTLLILLAALLFPTHQAMSEGLGGGVIETPVTSSTAVDLCMYAMSCTLIDPQTLQYDCQCVDPASISYEGLEVYPQAHDPYYSCDSWASCDPGYVCVYNPEAVWADGVGRGNWKCQDEDHDTYEYRECPSEVDYQEYCAWVK